MSLIFIAILKCVFGIGIFFCWLKYLTKNTHAAFTEADVVSAIENVLSGDFHDDWDLFLTHPIRDPYLESIRQKCLVISREHSGTETGKDIGNEGEEKLRSLLIEISNRA